MARLAFASYSDRAGLIEAHQHPYHELVLITAGRCSLRTGDQVVSAEAGHVVVHPAAIPHDQDNHGRVRTSYVGFVDAGGFALDFRAIPLPAGDPARRWLEDLVAGFREAGAPDQPELDHLLEALLARLTRIERRSAAAGHPGLDRVLRHLETHLADEHQLGDLAALAGCSVGHLGELARRELGCSVMRWLQERRLELATRLLRDPYRSVGEIAEECGYADLNYFIRLFRRRHGTTPGRFRAGG